MRSGTSFASSGLLARRKLLTTARCAVVALPGALSGCTGSDGAGPGATLGGSIPAESEAGTKSSGTLGALQRVLTDGRTMPVTIAPDRPTVVLLWSAWCEPSRASLVRLADLAEQPEAARWNFLAVTFHEPDDIAGAMHEMGIADDGRVTVCKDDHGRAFRALGVSGTPVALVRGAMHGYRAVVHPDALTPETLAIIESGGDPGLTPSDMAMHDLAEDAWDPRALTPDEAASIGVLLTRAEHEGNMSLFDPETGVIRVSGASAASLLASGLDMPSGRIEWHDVGDERSRIYRAEVVPPDGSLSTSRRMLAGSVAAEMGWSWEFTSREQEAWVITRRQDRDLPVSTADHASVSSRGPYFAGDATVEDVARWLEAITRTPAVDATELGSRLLAVELRVRSLEDIETAFAEAGLGVSKTITDVPVARVFATRTDQTRVR